MCFHRHFWFVIPVLYIQRCFVHRSIQMLCSVFVKITCVSLQFAPYELSAPVQKSITYFKKVTFPINRQQCEYTHHILRCSSKKFVQVQTSKLPPAYLLTLCQTSSDTTGTKARQRLRLDRLVPAGCPGLTSSLSGSPCLDFGTHFGFYAHSVSNCCGTVRVDFQRNIDLFIPTKSKP